MSALVNREIATREGLLEAWKGDPKCEVLVLWESGAKNMTCYCSAPRRFAEGLFYVAA